MDVLTLAGGRAGAGGIAEAAPETQDAVNAVRLRMGWEAVRSLLGLTDEDAGSLHERVLARVVLERAVDAHNNDVREANKKD